MIQLLLIIIIIVITNVSCFLYHSSRIIKYSNIRMSAVRYPTTIKSIITKLTSSMQKSLQNRQSRVEIELPPGASFGVEDNMKKKKKDDTSIILQSNREAARLIVEMFSVLASTTVVLFPTEAEAATARNIWNKKFKGQALAIDVPAPKGYGKLRSRKFSAEEQEQALLASDGVYVPPETEVLIVAGPRPKDYKKILKLSEKFGDGTLIILINSRLTTAVDPGAIGSSSDDTDRIGMNAMQLLTKYDNIFNYSPLGITNNNKTTINDLLKNREILLYHEHKSSWYLAEKAASSSSKGSNSLLDSVASVVKDAVGGSDGFTTIWEGASRPSEEELIAILSNSSANNSDGADQ